MGNSNSQEERVRREKEELDGMVRKLSQGPDLRVNKSIRMFTSLNSSYNLTQHYERRKMGAGGHAADWTKSLVEKLGALTPAPELAGLGALAIAIIIDSNSSGPPVVSTKEALRCVFAEEKASEVWDLIDECLKRCVMHIKNKDKLVGEIERIEVQLSAAITRLKNMGHMTSEALKAWVNGAAFHIQVLIHLVRLGGIQSCDPVERLISAYLSDLDLLFEKHREVIRGKCGCELALTTFWGEDVYQSAFVDEESKWHCIPLESSLQWSSYFEVYYDHRYVRQRRDIQQDFTQVKENLQQLVHQRGSFSIN